MKLFVRSVLCLFLCTSFSVLDAAEKVLAKKPSIKKRVSNIFHRSQTPPLSPIAEQGDSSSDKDEGKHNNGPDGALATTGRIAPLWGIPSSPRAASAVHANNGEEVTECDNRFILRPTLQDFFSSLLGLLKSEDRRDYHDTFYWQAPSVETIGKMEVSTKQMSRKDKIENSKRCYAQRYLRGIVEAAFTCDARRRDAYGAGMLAMRERVEKCSQEAQQETASVMISLEREKTALQEQNSSLQAQNNTLSAEKEAFVTEKNELVERLSLEKAALAAEKNGLAERIERDQRSLRTYRYALGAATVITAVSLGIARYAWSSGKPAQTTTA